MTNPDLTQIAFDAYSKAGGVRQSIKSLGPNQRRQLDAMVKAVARAVRKTASKPVVRIEDRKHGVQA